MGPTPITATHLAVAHYTVGALAHKIQMYCDAVGSTDPSGFDLIGRASLGNVGFSTLADPLFTVLAPFFTAVDVVFQDLQLFVRVGTTYIPLYTQATTVTPSLGGFFQPATGFDVVGKDKNNRNFHFYIYEGPFGIATKIVSYAGASANVKGLIDYLFHVGNTAVATDAYNWRRSRGDKESDRWLAGVIDTNEKLRRLRGIK
jgi:hypothetical protein